MNQIIWLGNDYNKIICPDNFHWPWADNPFGGCYWYLYQLAYAIPVKGYTFEIGTADGCSAIALAMACKKANHGRVIVECLNVQ